MALSKGHHKNNSEGYGPTWYDAWEYAKALEKAMGKRIVICMMPSQGRDKQFGWRCSAALEENPNMVGYGCFGPAFPGNGQKSFAASVYRALLELDERCATKWATEEEVAQAMLALDKESNWPSGL